MSYYDDEFYHEPSEFEQKVDEFKQSLLASVKQEHQDEISRLREENARLSAIEKEMNETIRNNKNGLHEIERRKKDLKSEVETEFYATNIEDVLRRYMDNSTVWYAARIAKERPKCNLCNDDRKQIANFPDGKVSSKSCECASLIFVYDPEISEIRFVKFNKRDSRYRSERSFYFNKLYSPSNNDSRDYGYQEFKIQHTVDTFCEETKQLHEDKGYGEVVSFTTKEECQKYCDWLNENKAG